MLRSETAASPGLRDGALRGLAAYQTASRPPPATLPVVASAGRARLRAAGGHGRPLVLIPSLINPPSILDLSPGRSLARWLAARGHRALLVDWGEPGGADRDLDLAGHVERLLLPLLAGLDAAPVLVGYCLGGTLAIAAADAARAAGLATIAAPWRFAGYGEARAAMAARWREARPACEALGVVPMEVLQAGFWQLDPARTIAKYAAFADLPHDGVAARAFVTLEDWANAGAPLAYAAGRDLFDALIAEDRPGRGTWVVGGRPVDPLALACPAVEFVSTIDRIVPAATAVGWAHRHEVAAGHVGMMVARRAEAALWRPLTAWVEALP